jgi:hypothetical protein
MQVFMIKMSKWQADVAIILIDLIMKKALTLVSDAMSNWVDTWL